MSSIYIQEPPTEGKVLLKTTFGEIDIELWSREAPKACRNFIQLCLEGFYNGLIFHRVVKNFIAQTGDPTGTGCTSVSVYGKPFKDEIHSRLRFARRGLVALANNGKDDNGSQFFFTLDATPELQGKHTIFGKVVGDTLFNLIKVNELIVDRDDRPVYEQKIIKAKVLNNPFPDIIPRVTSASKEPTISKEEDKNKKKESGVKNFKLLSFGDEAEEDEIENSIEQTKYVGKGKSTHDVLNDPKLSSKTINDEEEIEDEVDKYKKELDTIKNKLSGKTEKDVKALSKPADMEKLPKDVKVEEEDDLEEDNYFERQREVEKNEKLEKIRKEIKEFKRESKKEQKAKTAKEENEKKEESEKSEVLKEFEESQKKFIQLKQTINMKGESREKFTLDLMNKFKKQVQSRHQADSEESAGSSKKKKKSKHKEKSKPDSDSDTEINSNEWLQCQIKGENETVLAKDANTKSDDWYDIYDPRNPLNKRRRESHKHSSKKSKKKKNDD